MDRLAGNMGTVVVLLYRYFFRPKGFQIFRRVQSFIEELVRKMGKVVKTKILKHANIKQAILEAGFGSNCRTVTVLRTVRERNKKGLSGNNIATRYNLVVIWFMGRVRAPKTFYIIPETAFPRLLKFPANVGA